MKILTIGASPYLLVRNGKMHADCIQKFVEEGHHVVSAVWHHDDTYFMPTDDGRHEYVVDDKKICDLHPFTPKLDTASPIIYELLKKVQPQLVVTIGDHKDTNFFAAIKSMYPNLFKWLAVYTNDCLGLQSLHKDAFEFTDSIVTTSIFALDQINKIANINGLYLPYGIDHNKFYNKRIERTGVIKVARNMQSCNIAAFFNAVADIDTNSYLHTNLYDPGDYDIEYLADRFAAKKTKYTTDYCSIQDGISDDDLCNLYNSHTVYVDCSMKSATALSMLEAMACGCVPVGMNYARTGEILGEMPEPYRFFVPYNLYVGLNAEEYAIICAQKLKETITAVLNDKERLLEASDYAQQLAQKYSKKDFKNKIYSVAARTMNQKYAITIENLL